MGAGYFSNFQYEAWTRIPEVRIGAIYNRTEVKAREIMARYGIERYYGDWREMIDREKPDFVDIVTPPETHEEMCAYAAARVFA
jgi:D-apiose dehydrogenase